MKGPCSNCPWRRDAPVGYWHPDHFRSIYQTCQDDGMALMLCHNSKPVGIEATLTGAKPIPCAGAILVAGADSIGFRLAVMTGRIDPNEYGTNVPLYDSMREMLHANGVEPPPRNRFINDHEEVPTVPHKIDRLELPTGLRWKKIRSDGLTYWELEYVNYVMIAEPVREKGTPEKPGKPTGRWRAYGFVDGGAALPAKRDNYGSREAAQAGALVLLRMWLHAMSTNLARLSRKKVKR